MQQQTLATLQRIYIEPITVSSNYARTNAIDVAELASRGLITTHVGSGIHSKHWRVSAAGLAFLEFKTGE